MLARLPFQRAESSPAQAKNLHSFMPTALYCHGGSLSWWSCSCRQCDWHWNTAQHPKAAILPPIDCWNLGWQADGWWSLKAPQWPAAMCGAPLDPKDHKAIGKSPIIASRWATDLILWHCDHWLIWLVLLLMLLLGPTCLVCVHSASTFGLRLHR